MRNNHPTVILTDEALTEIVGAYERYYTAATTDPYDHRAYEHLRAELDACLLQFCGLRKNSPERETVKEALFDNYGNGRAMVIVSLTLSGFNVVVNNTFIPVGTAHYMVREALRTLPHVTHSETYTDPQMVVRCGVCHEPTGDLSAWEAATLNTEAGI